MLNNRIMPDMDIAPLPLSTRPVYNNPMVWETLGSLELVNKTFYSPQRDLYFVTDNGHSIRFISNQMRANESDTIFRPYTSVLNLDETSKYDDMFYIPHSEYATVAFPYNDVFAFLGVKRNGATVTVNTHRVHLEPMHTVNRENMLQGSFPQVTDEILPYKDIKPIGMSVAHPMREAKNAWFMFLAKKPDDTVHFIVNDRMNTHYATAPMSEDDGSEPASMFLKASDVDFGELPIYDGILPSVSLSKFRTSHAPMTFTPFTTRTSFGGHHSDLVPLFVDKGGDDATMYLLPSHPYDFPDNFVPISVNFDHPSNVENEEYTFINTRDAFAVMFSDRHATHFVGVNPSFQTVKWQGSFDHGTEYKKHLGGVLYTGATLEPAMTAEELPYVGALRFYHYAYPRFYTFNLVNDTVNASKYNIKVTCYNTRFKEKPLEESFYVYDSVDAIDLYSLDHIYVTYTMSNVIRVNYRRADGEYVVDDIEYTRHPNRL